MKRGEVQAIVNREPCEYCGATPGHPCIKRSRRWRPEQYTNAVHEPRRRAYMSTAMVKAGYEVVGVVLKDLDRGRSVTNDAEAVVAEVARAHPGMRILYFDTQGNLDELRHVNGVFTGFGRME